MTDLLELPLKKLAYVQKKYAVFIFILALLITGFLAIGLTKISVQSDLDKAMPQDLPIFEIENEIGNKFGGQDMVLIVIQLDYSDTKDAPIDIRDPRIIRFLVELEENLQEENLIDEVQSLGTIFKQTGVPESLEEVKTILSMVPDSEMFFNKDYSITLLYLSSDLGKSEEKVKELNKLILENIELSQKPVGIKTSVTGIPPMRSVIFDLLIHDAVFTLLIAAIIIFILLIVMEKSFTKAILIFFPLILGITWTLGTLGWLSIDLTIATAGIGAMILGLGVEYGTFLVTRYKEERQSKEQLESLQIAVSSVGKSIIGSGLTTIAGFLALTFSIMPMLGDLGITLALGIGFSLIIAVLVNPSIIILEENFEKWITQHQYEKNLNKINKHNSRK